MELNECRATLRAKTNVHPVSQVGLAHPLTQFKKVPSWLG